METNSSPVILILEDEALIAIDLELTLHNAGFEVVWFTHCTKADEWLESNSPSFAVIDIALVDGICVKAASVLAQRQIPFIVHSGDTEFSEHRDTIFVAGLWIGKPAKNDDLVLIVQELIELTHPAKQWLA